MVTTFLKERVMSAGIYVDYGDCLKGITVERDSSPGFAGAILYAKYQSIERVEKLLALGDLIELHETLKPSPSIGHYILLENEVVKEVRLQEGVCVSKNRDVRKMVGSLIKKNPKVKLREYKGNEVAVPFLVEGLEYIYVFNVENGCWKTFGLDRVTKSMVELRVNYMLYIKNLVYRDDISELTKEEKENLEYLRK